ncbi:MAG: hypothetical protein J6A16_04505 [Oscillospiraceae bacterium]|nr:hypothetical protein [Oscillospiraceae bacterium]
MTKKFVIISGIITLAALAAGLVAFFLTRNKAIAECLEAEDEELDFDLDDDAYVI